MYYKLKKEWRENLFLEARLKIGSDKNLIKEIKIVKSAFYNYKKGSRAIPEKVLLNLIEISNSKLEEENIEEKLENNWKQIMGGKNRVKKAKENGTFEIQLKKAWRGAKGNKKWHGHMKKTNPEDYYKSQYEKFKKIGGYKFLTLNGEKVRNKLELETANELIRHGIKYEYEPFILIDEKAFFPDFLVENKIIIECTMWRGYDKAPKLKSKIEVLKSKFKVYVLVPKTLNKYYQILNNHLISSLDEIVPLAQQAEHATVTNCLGKRL